MSEDNPSNILLIVSVVLFLLVWGVYIKVCKLWRLAKEDKINSQENDVQNVQDIYIIEENYNVPRDTPKKSLLQRLRGAIISTSCPIKAQQSCMTLVREQGVCNSDNCCIPKIPDAISGQGSGSGCIPRSCASDPKYGGCSDEVST